LKFPHINGDLDMKTEITLLVQVTALTGALWIPYVLNRVVVRGIGDTMGYPKAPKALAPWAERLRAAHANAVENLVVFAALVLAAQVAGISTPVTLLACNLYLWSRVVHVIAYTLAIPWVRTLAFVGGFVAQMMFVWQLLS
jgi:uncharacterized MAPEG superfamily protein